MGVSAYISFNGNCEEAVKFYQEVFEAKEPQIIRYSDIPAHPDYPLPEEAKNYIMHTRLFICESEVMFSDNFPGQAYKVGNNISLSIILNDLEKIKKFYENLKEGGEVEIELSKTQWSKCYGSVIDKFGMRWQLSFME